MATLTGKTIASTYDQLWFRGTTQPSADDGAVQVLTTENDGTDDLTTGLYLSTNRVGIGVAAPASVLHVTGTVQVGIDGTGHDVIFYSGTAGDNFTWDASEELLTITGTNGQTALNIADGNLVVADSVDIEGDIDVNGTANLDIVDIDGAVDMASTLTLAGNLSFGDSTGTGNNRARFGAGNDLQIWHDGSNSYVSDIGTGDLHIEAADNLWISNYSGEKYIKCVADGEVDIYYNNVVKFATTSTGISVTGAATFSGNVTSSGTFTTVNTNSSQTANSLYSLSNNYTYLVGGSGGLVLKEAVSETAAIIITANNISLTAGSGSLVLDTNSRISLSNNDSGADNTVFGFLAGAALTSNSNDNTLIGDYAGTAIDNSDNCIAIGVNALDAHTSGSDNIAIGSNAMGDTGAGANSKDSVQNVFIGSNAGGGTWTNAGASDKNVGIGYGAMAGALTGAGDGTVAVGHSALNALTSGAENTAIGYQAGKAMTTGGNLTAVGHNAATALPAGANANTAIGASALLAGNNATTDHNTCVGYLAGDAITNGNTNTIIGSGTDPSAGGGANQTVIGYGTTGVADNSVTLGNASCDLVYAAQDGAAVISAGGLGIGRGTTAPDKALEIYDTSSAPYVRITGSQTSGGPVEISALEFRNAPGNSNAQAKISAYLDSDGGTGDASIGLKFYTSHNSVTERMIITNTGEVGIGTSAVAPTYALTIADATTFATAQLMFQTKPSETNSRAWGFATDAANYGDFAIKSSNANDNVLDTTPFLINKDGSVGIGTAAPGQILDCNAGSGNMIADGYDTHSLGVYKENIEDASGYLDKVLACPAQKWNRKPFISANEIKEAVLDEFGEDVWDELFPEDSSHRQKALYNMPEGDLKDWIDEWCESKRVEMRPEIKWQKKRLGLVADDELTVEHLSEVIAINDEGEPTGIDTMTYIGILHNAVKELSAKVTALENA